MFSEIIRRSENALKQTAVWSVAVWSAVLIAIILLLGGAMIGGSLIPLMMSPVGLTGMAALSRVGGAMLLLMLVAILAGPFWIAGIYGTLADAVNGQTITWSTFWRNARILYGRGWGLIGFSALWALSIDIIMLVFGLLLHALGIVLGFAWVIATLPVIMRMTGGLFSRRLSWSESVRQSLTLTGWGELWLALAAYAVIAFIVLLLVSIVLGHIPLIGFLLVLALDIVIEVVGGIWAFAAYEVTTPAAR